MSEGKNNFAWSTDLPIPCNWLHCTALASDNDVFNRAFYTWLKGNFNLYDCGTPAPYHYIFMVILKTFCDV